MLTRLYEGCKAQQTDDKKKFDEELGQLKENCSKSDIERQQQLQRISEQESVIQMQNKKAKYAPISSNSPLSHIGPTSNDCHFEKLFFQKI